MSASSRFLTDSFLASYKTCKSPLKGLGEFVFRRTYARELPGGIGGTETWPQTVERVVNGTFRMQHRHAEHSGIAWDKCRANASAEVMYDRMFHMKFLPPGRGLWAMGTDLTESRGMFAALNNCAFVSTANLAKDPTGPFTFLMDAAMLGVGVGFDTRGAGSIKVHGPRDTFADPKRFVVEDSREGWVDSVRALLEGHFGQRSLLVRHFDYGGIRPAGAPIRGFGGCAAGPRALADLHQNLIGLLDRQEGRHVTTTTIVDIMNLIGKCIVSSSHRRTAEIAFGNPLDQEYINLKNYDVNPHRADYGWTSNNSVFAIPGCTATYHAIAPNICKNGEPGVAWLTNMRQFGRMADAPNDKDRRAMGGNPCLEQTLESYEACCLVETFPAHHESLEDFLTTLKYAFLYAKTVTLGMPHWKQTAAVMAMNRRVGTSISGIAQFLGKHDIDTLKYWCDTGYQKVQSVDASLSRWLQVPQSIKTTCVKPSGTVSLLAGATPGMHFPESQYYIRRVRVGIQNTDLLSTLAAAGYPLEPDVNDPEGAVVASFPVHAGHGVKTRKDLTMRDQLELAAFLQAHWADNQVSCTVTFDPKTEGPHLAAALAHYDTKLKGVSFLPNIEQGAYPQMPYEAIDVDTYIAMTKNLKPLHWGKHDNAHQGPDAFPAAPDAFCDGDKCIL